MIGGRIFPAISHTPVTIFAANANRPKQARPKNRNIIYFSFLKDH